jgi:hypothetical protein
MTNDCEHEWVVFSTVLAEKLLMVQCVKCGAMGTIDRPTKQEWRRAFRAPSCPYRWHDGLRVTIRHPICPDFYVVRKQPGLDCPCTWRPKVSEYERVPVEITRRAWKPNSLTPTPEEQRELMELADFVAKTDLCSTLFPAFIGGIQQHMGHEPPAATREIANRIEDIHNKGLHFRPAIVARVLRLYAMTDQFHKELNDDQSC